MRLYTKRGDDGNTDLFGGDRVGKHHARVTAYGQVDEMNAALGVAGAACDADTGRLLEVIRELQDGCFRLGADLASPPGGEHSDRVPRLTATDVETIEAYVDEIDGENEPLKTFVLPGGGELSARLHLARAVTRRAERAIVLARETEDISEEVVHWINRVGDLLFAMARAANRIQGVPDVPWTPGS
ncbi:MAG: cob(I)yrinic acid a,c-diamide adenosyltransferase [Phycisphaerales bacterium]|nr:cob(I)yrinic acid a,c-diamide adenosyltransferase [Phycisphaerales bacterium]